MSGTSPTTLEPSVAQSVNSVFKFQVEEKIPEEKLNMDCSMNCRTSCITIKVEVPGLQTYSFKINFYPNHQNTDRVYVTIRKGSKGWGPSESSETNNMVLLWAGRFQPGNEDLPVKLEDERSWTYRSETSSASGGHEMRCILHRGKFPYKSEIPEHIINGSLIFKAEIQVSYKRGPQLWFDQSPDKKAFLDNLATKLGSNDSDLTVKASDGKSFSCHKLVLSAHSEYFRTLLDSDNRNKVSFDENTNNEVFLKDVDENTLEVLLRYMYSMEFPNNVNQEQVAELLVASDRLRMDRLVEICLDWLICRVKEDLIQVFIIIDKIQPKGTARLHIFERMKRSRKSVAASKDFPQFVREYPELPVEFMKAVLL